MVSAAHEEAVLGLYLHIPFCESICNYCNFNRGLFDAGVKNRYVDALVLEIAGIGNGEAVDTVYFGGGTPSLLEPAEVDRLLGACREAFSFSSSAEVTLEVNPESASSRRLSGWREAGVNRLSFGVQSFSDVELKRLDRRHSAKRARDAVGTARAEGYDAISLDLMLWLPGQASIHCRHSVKSLLELEPEHASFYLLELYPNAPLREDMARSGVSLAPEEDAVQMYLETLEMTDVAGYEQYEISNVSKPGKKCRHNLKYWTDGEWLGFGCGAHSTRGGSRWSNISETVRYIENGTSGQEGVLSKRGLSDDEWLGDALFMGLRLTEGLDLRLIEQRYGISVMEKYGAALAPFIEKKRLLWESGRLRLTREGMLIANDIMGAFV